MNVIGKRKCCAVVLLAFVSGALLGVLVACQSSLGLSPSMFSLVEHAQKLFSL